MKEQKNFVVAVIAAMCVPVLFGCIYLYKMETTHGSNNFITKLENKRELFIFGSQDLKNIKKEIFKDEEYKASAYEQFEVDYASGPENEIIYTLKLRDIYLGRKVLSKSITWRLERASKNDEFVQVGSGNFDSLDGQIILNNFAIQKGETDYYRIYYYFNEEVNDKNFFTKVIVE